MKKLFFIFFLGFITASAFAKPTESPQPAPAEPLPSGFYLGYRFQYFDYTEPAPNVHEYGPLNGVVAGYDGLLKNQNLIFYKAELEYLVGTINYDGYYQSGGALNAGSNDVTWQARIHVGFSTLSSPGFLVQFYSGLDDRYLYDYVQAPGGYRREISQLSIPFGWTLRKVSEQFTYSITGEVETLITGTVKSYLSDVGPTYVDIQNKQSRGYGLRVEGSFEFPRKVTWIIQPSIRYWVVDDSDVVTASGKSYLEPHNVSKMYNLSLLVRF